MTNTQLQQSLHLRAGDWIQVRSKEEILSTLDQKAQLDALPFMPQMLQWCGMRFKVWKRAHKLCDTVNSTAGFSMTNAVFLENLRCDGEAYGGCEMRCMIIWKEAWLERVSDPNGSFTETVSPAAPESPKASTTVCSEADVWAATRVPKEKAGSEDPVYTCQAVQLPYATRRLPRWDVRQYVEDYTSGNARLSKIVAFLLFFFFNMLKESGLGFGTALRWVYDLFQRVRGGTPYPCRLGELPKDARTPVKELDLQPGEWVRVKDYQDILMTVDKDLKNRGMSFHAEMVPDCGRTFQVLQRVQRIMNEKTGTIMKLKNVCLVLDGSDCHGRYTRPLFCPRACYPYWREIWLERVPKPDASITSESSANPKTC